MADEGGGRRPRRRCASTKAAMPSAIHYVGYVEEDETPEMIMKKFEELEKVMAASEAAPAEAKSGEEGGEAETGEDMGPGASSYDQDHMAGLTDAQLMEVFKQTSIFNVRSALANNDALMSTNEAGDNDERFWDDMELSEDEELWAEMRQFWSDDEDDGDVNRSHWKRLRRGQLRGSRGPGRAPRAAGAGKQRHNVITHYNAVTQALIRRKVKVADPDAIYRIQVPLPLPLSWGRSVQPYMPRGLSTAASAKQPAADLSAASSSKENTDVNGDGTAGHAGRSAAATALPQGRLVYHEVADLTAADFKALGRGFQGILINQGWEVKGATGDASVACLAKLPVQQLCPVGFIFIWVDKVHVAAVVKLLYKWGYIYVENLTWVQMAPNNTIITAPSPYAQRSHLTLFIFRKNGEGKDIELRHQRNPDVLFDCVRKQEGQVTGVPAEAISAIETLLPTGKDKFLELYAPIGASRPGWTHIAQTRDQ
ncbi:hypothetical protein COCOBI_11-4240 [Coccomyxa sp. Obi]|nr:hypothetical protein COCOBI_11-4240 [Coccomyxa sp. Obi]